MVCVLCLHYLSPLCDHFILFGFSALSLFIFSVDVFLCSGSWPSLFPIASPTMSSASSSSTQENQLTRRMEIWAELHRDLNAAGLPWDAHPQGPPPCYGSYSVRGPLPERNPINVLPLVRRFLIPSQVTRGNHSNIIDWGDDTAGAWRDAKRLARWCVFFKNL